MARVLDIPSGKAKLKRPIRKFQVLEGVHTAGVGGATRTFLKGHIVASHLDLDELFANKFVEVPREVKAHPGIENYKIEVPGMEPQRKRKPLLEMEEEVSVDEVDPEALEESTHEFLKEARDVSERFPILKSEAKGLKVFKNGVKYGVVSDDAPDEVLNTRGPLKKDEVIEFIESFLSNGE